MGALDNSGLGDLSPFSQIHDPLDVFGTRGAEAAKDAAEDAARVQAEASRTNIAESARQFDITQANLQPRIEAGNLALEQQRALLGLGTGRTDPNADRRLELESQIVSLQGQQGQLGERSGSSGMVGQLVNRVLDQREPGNRSDLQGQIDALNTELGGLPEFTAQTPEEEQQAAFAAFNESPGQAFLRERAERSLVRQAGALGGLGGGNVRSELTRQGVGFAQQDFQNQFGRLGQISGQGQAAATNIGQFGQQAVGQQGQFRQGGSEARASGIFGVNQANQQQTQGLQQTAGTVLGAIFGCDTRLKTDITELARDQLGGVYSFRYRNNDTLHVGRMAQELLETRPDAVITDHESGYLHVTEEFKPEIITWH